MGSYTMDDLLTMQEWPLERKIRVTQTRILEWYLRWDGQVYVSFSGGKDSTVLLDLARRVIPNIEAVFVDTGLEFPEVREFVKTQKNITWLKPEMSFRKVIEVYGYPVISKEVANRVRLAKPGNTRWKQLHGTYTDKYGNKSAFNSAKWRFLLDAPFKISEQCCDIMKKNPARKFQKETGKKPIFATLASESRLRLKTWLQHGCNAFDAKEPSSQPMSFWTEQDILLYLKAFRIPYAKVYGDIVIGDDGKLTTTGEKRTGCVFCMFGIHLEKEPNRFQRLAITHPQLYDYCINKLGCGKVLEYIGVNYKPLK